MNDANRSPDVAWIRRWKALSPERRRKIPPIEPGFVIELRSATNTLKPLQAKMQKPVENGVRWGWLIYAIYKLLVITMGPWGERGVGDASIVTTRWVTRSLVAEARGTFTNTLP